MGLNNSVCPLVLALSKFQGAVVPPKSCSWEHATAAPQLLGQYWSMFPHPAMKGAPAHAHCSARDSYSLNSVLTDTHHWEETLP